MAKFAFYDLEIWQRAIAIGDMLFDIADPLEQKHRYRFAEQVRRAGMSMLNTLPKVQDAIRTKSWPAFAISLDAQHSKDLMSCLSFFAEN